MATARVSAVDPRNPSVLIAGGRGNGFGRAEAPRELQASGDGNPEQQRLKI
jgi:hypothetical protein